MCYEGCELLHTLEGKWEKSSDYLLAQRDLSEKMNVKDQLMMKWSKRHVSTYFPLSILKQITFTIEYSQLSLNVDFQNILLK